MDVKPTFLMNSLYKFNIFHGLNIFDACILGRKEGSPMKMVG
jgi:hypothetical protein